MDAHEHESCARRHEPEHAIRWHFLFVVRCAACHHAFVFALDVINNVRGPRVVRIAITQYRGTLRLGEPVHARGGIRRLARSVAVSLSVSTIAQRGRTVLGRAVGFAA